MARAIVVTAIATFVAVASPAIAQSFGGYPCTDDCSGHEAGHDWAEQNGIDDASGCGGNSDSFIEGCKAYVEENHPETQDDGSGETVEE